MNKLLVTAVFVLSALFSHAQNFEGIIEVDAYTRATEDQTTLKWMLKEGNHRFDFDGIAKGTAYTTTLLMQKKDAKMFLLSEVEGKMLYYPATIGKVSDPLPANAQVTKTGEKKTIAGKSCYLVKIESAEGATDCWVTDELALSLDDYPPLIKDKGVMGLLKANGINGVPMEVVSKDKTGEVIFSFTIKKITPKTLDANLFELPANAQNGEELIRQSVQQQKQ